MSSKSSPSFPPPNVHSDSGVSMVKGDYRSTVAQLSKSLSGSTLEPREKERVQRGVNAVLNDMR